MPNLRSATRVALIHDLWHALTGYGGDPQGEYQLLWFTWAQDQEPMVLALASVAFLSSVTDGLASVRHKYKLAMEAIHRGRRAIWLLPLPYENLLGEPISEVREQLRI